MLPTIIIYYDENKYKRNFVAQRRVETNHKSKRSLEYQVFMSEKWKKYNWRAEKKKIP